jgi:hypothetical protein
MVATAVPTAMATVPATVTAAAMPTTMTTTVPTMSGGGSDGRGQRDSAQRRCGNESKCEFA